MGSAKTTAFWGAKARYLAERYRVLPGRTLWILSATLRPGRVRV